MAQNRQRRGPPKIVRDLLLVSTHFKHASGDQDLKAMFHSQHKEESNPFAYSEKVNEIEELAEARIIKMKIIASVNSICWIRRGKQSK